MKPKHRRIEACPYRVYVALGFHTSFHHSWRGDTPDESGFGTDIRVVRGILALLEEAAVQGRRVRAYWDLDVYWTLQQILPHYAPDIIEGIRRRVEAGLDEIVVGYFNTGANHAATERELRAATAWAHRNPWGSGLEQVFPHTTSLLRPQESMHTAGMNAVLREEGITGLVLYYASVPFNALSTFLPTLPPEQRYNPLWLRMRADEPPLVLLPCISPPDLIDEVCLEALLLSLRRLQTSGSVRSDLLVHINFDADAETWLPMPVPRALRWFPNTGGLREHIQVVDRYPWAEFALPSEYVASHLPQAEVQVGQDLADGGWDGNYSWAEKHGSQVHWTLLERSRLHSYRAEALLRRAPAPEAESLRRRLWEGTESAFFGRLVGLTTTHFGMSTPVINAEREAKARALLGGACECAAEVERAAAQMVRDKEADEDALYAFELMPPVCEEERAPGPVQTIVRLPVWLPAGADGVQLTGGQGQPVPVSLVNLQSLPGGQQAGELLFAAHLGPEGERFRLRAGAPAPARPTSLLRNQWLELQLAEEAGVQSLRFDGRLMGDEGFLEPFVTYRTARWPRSWLAPCFRLLELGDEQWSGLSRARLVADVPMDTLDGPVTSRFTYTFALFEDLPYLLLDVEAEYAATPERDRLHTLQQKLGRCVDRRWIEVAPCQLHPQLTGTPSRPLRVWKHNYLGVTASYDLNYRQANPRNRDLDAFNHQVTAGWVALSDREHGLLLAESAERLASLAFCPMRLREREGQQRVWLNPFGSYFGRQPDYRHLGGSGVGARFTSALSGALRPNGPSFNGQRVRFSLLLAPYRGDAPPAGLQAQAAAFFYAPAVVIHRAPEEVDAVVPGDLQRVIESAAPAISVPVAPSRPESRRTDETIVPHCRVARLSAGLFLRLAGQSLRHVVATRLRRRQP